MRVEELTPGMRTLYADEGKVLDFKEPKFVVNQDRVQEPVHIYASQMKLGRLDSPDNYIEIDKSEIQ